MKIVEFAEPFDRLTKTLAEAESTGMDNHNAMVVSSVDENQTPWSRVVLLKSHDEDGLVFFTNFKSRKGRQILNNPNVCLNFHWRELEKQVIVRGAASQVCDEEADAYFATRPRQSQLGAWASHQSQPLSNRAELVGRAAMYEAKHLLQSVPRPPHWSGFRVEPIYFEFWTAKPFRLHERCVYERNDEGWSTILLNP